MCGVKGPVRGGIHLVQTATRALPEIDYSIPVQEKVGQTSTFSALGYHEDVPPFFQKKPQCARPLFV